MQVYSYQYNTHAVKILHYCDQERCVNEVVQSGVFLATFGHRLLLFSSPGQSPGRAIVVPPASALASVLAAAAVVLAAAAAKC